MSCLCYEHDVRLSVCLSVTLVDCDHIVRQKVEICSWQDRSGSWILVCWSRPGSYYPVIPNSTDEGWCCMKMWSFALQPHPTAHMSRYLSICWASYSSFFWVFHFFLILFSSNTHKHIARPQPREQLAGRVAVIKASTKLHCWLHAVRWCSLLQHQYPRHVTLSSCYFYSIHHLLLLLLLLLLFIIIIISIIIIIIIIKNVHYYSGHFT